jgi:hypothetical protein
MPENFDLEPGMEYRMTNKSQNWRTGARLTVTVVSLVAGAAFAGCAKPDAAEVKQASAAHEHGHGEEGPHHGQLIELGEEEFHAELMHDDANQKVTVYVLDHKAQAGVPIGASEIMVNLIVSGKPIQFAIPAVPDSSDPSGKSSRFELANKDLSDALDSKDMVARLSLTIEGKAYTGMIGPHDHEGHSHK